MVKQFFLWVAAVLAIAITFLGGAAYYYETQDVFDIDLTSYTIYICTWKSLNPFQSSAVSSLEYIGFTAQFIDTCIIEKGGQFEYEDENWNIIRWVAEKPVIYLYPETTQAVDVYLDYDGDLFATYPEYDEHLGGRSVTAQPDSTLINHADEREYSYLFWEGKYDHAIDRDLTQWFVVPWSETKTFLQDILPQIGLTPVEYNEFIVYWFPLMQDNPYNLIHFAQEQYTDTARLSTVPAADSMLRVFMVWKALDAPFDIPPQTFPSFERRWFTVVEWGGTQLSD
jgi:hypothetical protein